MFRRVVEKVFDDAGIELNGARPYDFRATHPGVYRRILLNPGMGIGESYMDGWWECDQLDEFVNRLIRSKLAARIPYVVRPKLPVLSALANLQSERRALEVARRHYDIDAGLFRSMLDPRMVYTCGYWREATTLAEAQEAKLELVCRKLGLEPGMTVLDIGCGYGSFMKYAAERYGVKCVGYNISREQVRVGRELCEGLPVQFVEQDYRTIEGRFDRVISIGMFEAVGRKNFRTYMQVVHRVLDDNGLFLLHTMGGHVTKRTNDPWFDRYIFPNGFIPSIAQLGRSFEGLFTMEDWHTFGPDYDRTLLAWHENFTRAWPELSRHYPERFRRMWEFYLLSFAGSFRARTVNLWQLVLSKTGRDQPPCRVS